MKNYKLLINLGIIALLWFCLAFACKSNNYGTTQRKNDTAPVTKNTEKSSERRTVKSQTGVGAPYEARDPYPCADTSQPTDIQTAAENFRCNIEEISGGKLHLVENVVVSEMESPRQYKPYSDMQAWGIDATQPITPISGSFDLYVCDEVSDYMQNSGKNCLVFPEPEAEGLCYKTADGEWKCIMQDTTSAKTTSTKAPPR